MELLDLEYIKENISPIYEVEPILTHLLYVENILILTKESVNIVH